MTHKWKGKNVLFLTSTDDTIQKYLSMLVAFPGQIEGWILDSI